MCGTMQPHQQSSGTNTTAVAKSQDGFTSLRFLYCQLVSAKMNSTWAVTWLTEEVAFLKYVFVTISDEKTMILFKNCFVKLYPKLSLDLYDKQ